MKKNCFSFQRVSLQLQLVQLLFVGAFLGGASLEARVWIVDNQEHRPADFRSIQAANDSEEVKALDTLMIRPSPELYIGARITKTLTIVGNGYYHAANGIQPGGFSGATKTWVRSLVFSVATDPLTNQVLSTSEASIVTGITFADKAQTNSGADNLTITVPHVLIERCNFIRDTSFGGEADIVIQKSNFETPHSVVILNCNIHSFSIQDGHSHRVEGCIGRGGPISTIRNTFINHCTFRQFRTSGTVGLDGCIVENCILMSPTSKIEDIRHRNSVIRGNVFIPRHADNWKTIPFPEANHKVDFLDFPTVLIDNQDWESDFKLASNSPAKGKGLNGINPGAFDGPRPYSAGGLPPIPAITELRVPTVVSKQSGLPLRIKAAVRR